MSSSATEDTNVFASRWWDGAFVLIAGLVALEAATGSAGSSRSLTFAALTFLVVAQLTLGHRARVSPGTPVAWAYVTLLILGVGVTCAGTSTGSIILMAACPMLWGVTATWWQAVWATLALEVVVIVGSAMSDYLVGGLLIAVLSFALSLTLGTWVTRESQQAAKMTALVANLTEAQDTVGALERQAGQDAERERVAREIHDTIAQSLTGLVMTAQRARRSTETSDPEAADQFAVIEELATDALTEARALVAGYSAPEGDGGLAESFNRLIASFTRETGITVALDVESTRDMDLSREQQVVLLRCAQESLANVRKHARATHVSMSLTRCDDGLRLRIQDNGIGVSNSRTAPGEGTGISGMRRRVELAAGRITVADSAPEGTLVQVELP